MDTIKPLAVVTGASSGIGFELAKQFATNDYNLLIAAEDAELETWCIKATGAVDALALNAGIGAGGSFAGPDDDRTLLEQELQIVDLNVRSTIASTMPDDKGDPAVVARDGFEALMAGKERVVSASLKTKAQGRGARFLPDSAKAEMHRKMAEPGSAKE
jgi:NAD(P)-dependent dehydrogenase (short-subunit alcohol dehydrogenase family)